MFYPLILRSLVLSFVLLGGCLDTIGADIAQLHTVLSDEHPMAVWEKSAKEPSAVILLLHGRTWSSLPDFD